MLSRAALILSATIFVVACNQKAEPTATSTAPATAAEPKPTIMTTEGPIKAGANYGTFKATSPTELKLAKETTLTATPEGPIVAFRINDGTGGTIRCERANGCPGACTWETSSTDANCSGTSEGADGDDQACACAWHYRRPDGSVAE